MRTFYRDDTNYRRNSGLAAWGLLIIPLFLLLLGLGAYNLFSNSSTKQTNQARTNSPTGKPLFGIGGAPPTATPQPSKTPTPSRKPTATVTPALKDSTQQNTIEYGIGGGPGDSQDLPSGAPRTGGGGSYER